MMRFALAKAKKNPKLKALSGELNTIDQVQIEPIVKEWTQLCYLFFKLKLACNYVLCADQSTFPLLRTYMLTDPDFLLMQTKLIKCLCNLFLGTSFEQVIGKIGGTMEESNLTSEPDVRENEFFETILHHSAKFLLI